MSNDKFTTQAAILWDAVPLEVQESILKAVFCIKCTTAVRMVSYSGIAEKNGDLIIEGSCAVCGQQVVRVVETSETRTEHN